MEKRNNIIKAWGKWLGELALIALVIFATRSVVADWNHVPSGSMKPSLLEGDMIFVDRLAYGLKIPFTTWHLREWEKPRRGEIVVFDSPADGRLLVKRVIAEPGDTVAMRNNVLYLNGRAVDYAPLEHNIIERLSKDEQNHHRFAREQLDDIQHPVMVAQGVTPQSNFGPITIPEDQYLMLGDNRDNSADSRIFGFVERKAILGRATHVILSWDRDNYYLPRSGRSFIRLQ